MVGSPRSAAFLYAPLKEKLYIKTIVSWCMCYILEIEASHEADPVGKFVTTMRLRRDVFRKEATFDWADDHKVEWLCNMYADGIGEEPKLNAILRDLYEYCQDSMLERPTTVAEITAMIEAYIEFKDSVNTVSDEVSNEVDRLANMSDEEFEEEMAKEDDEGDDSDEPVGASADPDDEQSSDDSGASDDEPQSGVSDDQPAGQPEPEVRMSSGQATGGIPITIINPKK